MVASMGKQRRALELITKYADRNKLGPKALCRRLYFLKMGLAVSQTSLNNLAIIGT